MVTFAGQKERLSRLLGRQSRGDRSGYIEIVTGEVESLLSTTYLPRSALDASAKRRSK